MSDDSGFEQQAARNCAWIESVARYRGVNSQNDEFTFNEGWDKGRHHALASTQQPQGPTCQMPEGQKHPMWAQSERKIVGTWETLTDKQIADGWSYEGGQGEPCCILCHHAAELKAKEAELAKDQERIGELERELKEWQTCDLAKMAAKRQDEATNWMQQAHAARERIIQLERKHETRLQMWSKSDDDKQNHIDRLTTQVESLEATVRAANELYHAVATCDHQLLEKLEAYKAAKSATSASAKPKQEAGPTDSNEHGKGE